MDRGGQRFRLDARPRGDPWDGHVLAAGGAMFMTVAAMIRSNDNQRFAAQVPRIQFRQKPSQHFVGMMDNIELLRRKPAIGMSRQVCFHQVDEENTKILWEIRE